MKSKSNAIFILFLVALNTSIILGSIFSLNSTLPSEYLNEDSIETLPNLSNYDQFILGNFSGYEFSSYNLSVYLDEDTSSVAGNLTVDYYNNDPVNFSRLPFHIYASGMEYDQRPGYIEIINVTTTGPTKEEMEYEVLNSTQLMWVNLTETLEPYNRTEFIISFNTTLPDGGIDRANEYGWDHNQSRIFKFANCYPQPCVYDEFDGWNIDPYYLVGDPFYFDMAYYDLKINVPWNMTVAATGELLKNTTIGDRTIHHYNPKLPVREITFSASHYFVVQSFFAEGANVTVSAYYLNSSAWLWENFALDVLGMSGSLYFVAFGNYTYPTLNVVQEYTHYGGMEYPCQVYASTAADTYYNPWLYLETVIAHEIAHQWFYNFVGIDEVDWGFVDEGIVCWVTDWYKEVYHPDWGIFEPYWLMEYVWDYSFNYGLPNRINQSIPEYMASGTDYWYTAYRKAPVVLENFRRMVGELTLIEGLSLFTKEHFFDIATFEDFKLALEISAGESLDWFFDPWFNNPYLPKYNFSSVIYDATNKIINITIEDLNEDVNPYTYSQLVPIEIYSSSSTLEYNGTKWINSTTSLLIPIENVPERIVLNYIENIPVELLSKGITYIDTTDITIINTPSRKISGFSIPITLLTLGLLGIIIIVKKYRTYQK